LALKPRNVVISPGPGAPSEAGISKSIISAFEGKVPILGVCLGHQSIIEVYGGEIIRCPHIMHGKVSPVYHDGKGVYAGLAASNDIHSAHFTAHQTTTNSSSPADYNKAEKQPFISSFLATRYHSLVGNPNSLPDSLILTSYVEESQLTQNNNNLSNKLQPSAEEEKKPPQTTTTDSKTSPPHHHHHQPPHPHHSSIVGQTIMGVRHKEFTIEGVQFHPESVTTQNGMKLLNNFLRLRGGRWEEATLE